MADAKEILGLTSLKSPPERKAKAQRENASKKPEGISREVYALTKGLPPIMPTIDIVASTLKKKSASSQKTSWKWKPIVSSARNDDLQVYHWERFVDDKATTSDYPFAKYNKRAEVPAYSDSEYSQLLMDQDWTRQESDHLMRLCAEFDLRFVVIADRYNSYHTSPSPSPPLPLPSTPSSANPLPSALLQNERVGGGGGVAASWPERSVEEIKNRFYTITRKLLAARSIGAAAAPEGWLPKESFNFAAEVERKRVLGILTSHSRRQERQEEEVLQEAERILKSRGLSELPPVTLAADADARAVPAPPLEARPTPAGASAPSAAGGSRVPRVYVRGARLAAAVQAANNTAGARMTKRIEQTLEELRVPLKPLVPTRPVCAESIALRKDIVALLNLQKKVLWKENEAALLRENPNADLTPSAMAARVARVPRGLPNPVPTAIASVATNDVAIGNDQLQKEAQKKHHARTSEPPAPTQKRARRMKVLDD